MTGRAADEYTQFCAGVTKAGKPCPLYARRDGSGLCINHAMSPEERKAHMAELTEARRDKLRATVEAKNATRVCTQSPADLPNADADRAEPELDPEIARNETIDEIARSMRITREQARDRLDQLLAEPVRLVY